MTPRHFAWQAWHLATFIVSLRDRRDLATSTFILRGRRGAWRHPPSLCVAGMALLALGWVFLMAMRHLSHTVFHTPPCHTPSFTHNFVTHHLSHTHTTLSHTILNTHGVISKFLYPDSDEKHVHCVFTGLRLISSIAPTNLKKIGKKHVNFHQNLAHVASARLF